VPAANLLGRPGGAFEIAQTRLSGGRIHHAMRTVGLCQKAFDMMCERAISRTTQGSLLSEKEFVQGYVADSWTELMQFRLLVLHTAWLIDRGDKRQARLQVAAVKAATAKIIHDVVYRAMHLHGSLGLSNEMPLAHLWMMAPVFGVADGPTEVHKVTVSKMVLKQYQPAPGLFPSTHLPTRRAAARAKFAALLDLELDNL
jgi:acyl-CoA dehydrogenase